MSITIEGWDSEREKRLTVEAIRVTEEALARLRSRLEAEGLVGGVVEELLNFAEVLVQHLGHSARISDVTFGALQIALRVGDEYKKLGEAAGLRVAELSAEVEAIRRQLAPKGET